MSMARNVSNSFFSPQPITNTNFRGIIGVSVELAEAMTGGEGSGRLLRIGLAAGYREVGLMGEVARGRYRHMTDGAVADVHDYPGKISQMDP